MSNTDVTRGKWQQAKGAVKERWGEITDDEYRQTEGNIDQLAGKIQEKYGHAKEDVAEQLNKLLEDDDKK